MPTFIAQCSLIYSLIFFLSLYLYVESPDSDLDNTSNMTLALVAGGGAALMLLIALVLLISTKYSAR